MEGWIKLHRCLLESFVFSNPTTLKIWVWILLKATKNERIISIKIGAGFQDIKLLSGQLLFGRYKAEEQLNIDGSTIYKHIKKLEESGNILLNSNNHYTTITICKWDEYQEKEIEKEQPNDSQMTAKEQQSNNRVTTEEQQKNTNKKVKKVKKVKEYNPESFLLQKYSESYFDKKYLNDKSQNCFDELIRLDNYTQQQIENAIKLARSDPFWQTNFLSPLKLRNKDKNGVKFIDRFLAIKSKTNGTNGTDQISFEQSIGPVRRAN
jgi:hypothetical protein